jgi:DNA-binding CsgD family transcriptional regulator
VDEPQFIGRERELAALAAQLGSTSLVTVAGPRGCGKTRLAREAAERSAHGADQLDSVVVELAALRDPGQLADTVLRALGENALSATVEALAAHLTSHPALLVLDDCGHLATAVGALVSALPRSRPARILATSRVPLGLPDEVVFAVSNLGVPEPNGGLAEVVRSDAARFLVACAVERDAGFTLTPGTASDVVHICRALDGLPMALMLAAQQLTKRGQSPADLSLSKLPKRAEDAVRAALEWSVARLNPSERGLLARLTVFRSPWSLEAAWRVCRPATDRLAVLDQLERLAKLGLVRPAGTERWSLAAAAQLYPEPLGSFANARLLERYLGWFSEVAITADVIGREPWGHDRLVAEAPDLSYASQLALEKDPVLALEMAAGMMNHWRLSEQQEEGYGRAVAGIEAAPGAPASLRALVQLGGAMLAGAINGGGDHAAQVKAGLALVEDAEDLARATRCRQLAGSALVRHAPEQALRLGYEAAELSRVCGNQAALAAALVTVAQAATSQDRPDLVRGAREELDALPASVVGSSLRAAVELAAAEVKTMAGEPSHGLEHAEQSLAETRQGEPAMRFAGLAAQVHSLARAGLAVQARRVGLAALAEAKRSALPRSVIRIELALAVAELALMDLDGAERHIQQLPLSARSAVAAEVCARVALARTQSSVAAGFAQEIATIGRRRGSLRLEALADYCDGYAALLRGDQARAAETLQSALALQFQMGLEIAAIESLEALGALAAAQDDVARSARLLGAGSSARVRLDGVLLPPRPAESETVKRMRERGEWDRHWSEGAALSLERGIAYARRGRGGRERAAWGWQSLTRTELEVARLAASGASNPEIGRQLFMARGTVKAHLASTYRKLNVPNRTVLAKEMAGR